MYDELAFEMQRTQRMRLGEQQSNSPVPFLDNCMSMCEARVAIASWPSTRKAKSAPVPLLCSLSTRSANVGHVTPTAPCLWTPILRSCLSHNRLHSLSPTFIWNCCQDKYGYEGNVVG